MIQYGQFTQGLSMACIKIYSSKLAITVGLSMYGQVTVIYQSYTKRNCLATPFPEEQPHDL